MQAIAEAPITVPTIPGTPFAGGFYVSRFHVGAAEYALVVAPRAEGEIEDTAWGEYGKDIPGARSCFDGLANTKAMAEAGSAMGAWALGMSINGQRDWYLPSRDELEMLYRHLKPTEEENCCSFRDGDNASSIPVTYPYTAEEPAQTSTEAFQEGGAEAFGPEWYWSSTQYSRYSAYCQGFSNGDHYDGGKDSKLRARAVRRFIDSPI
jgi:hypothetical protein